MLFCKKKGVYLSYIKISYILVSAR